MSDVVLVVLAIHAFWLLCLVFVLFWQTHQGWVALDQWLHCVFYADAMADETYSARCWREYTTADSDERMRKWARRVAFINWLFADDEHCQNAFIAERSRKQLPVEYGEVEIFEEVCRRG